MGLRWTPTRRPAPRCNACSADLWPVRPHLRNDAVVTVRVRVLRLAEDARPGDKGICAGGGNLGDVVGLTPPSISSRISRPEALMISRACFSFVQCRRNEALAAKPGLTDISRIMSILSMT